MDEIQKILDPVKFTGRASQLTTEFIEKEVNPILEANDSWKGMKEEAVKV